jgi:hypothetical protein
MLVLAVKFDELAREVLERTGRHQRSIDKGTAATLGGDLTPNHDFVITTSEDGLDGRDFFACSHELRRSTAAEKKPHGSDEDGLPGPGFASQNIESWLELDIDGVDDGEPGNPQEAKHRRKRTPILT